jgi:DNA repair protein RecO (recombination protein O)
MSYIVNTSVEKLYTFTVTDSVLRELQEIADDYRKRFMDRKMKSLEMLNEIL